MAGLDPSLLDRALYGFAQVDRLLGLRGGTSRRWIDGYERNGRHYPPVVRHEPTGNEAVTWGEFVETQLLAEFRDSGVPMLHMRPVVERLRIEYNTPYPLAWVRPLALGLELLERIQNEEGVPDAMWIVIRTGQGMLDLAPAPKQHIRRVEWSHKKNGFTSKIFPLGRTKAVAYDPLRAFGAPAVGGIRTEILAEEVEAGEAVALVARAYGVPVKAVRDAVAFEAQQADLIAA